MWWKGRARWVALLGVAVIALWMSGGLGAGWRWSGDKLRDLGVIPGTEQQDLASQNEGDSPLIPSEPGVPAIQPSTTLVYRTLYVPCDLEAREEYQADMAYVGQSREEFLMHNPGWQLVSFSPDRVVLEREVAGKCEEFLAARTIKIQDGYVTVFFGSDDEGAPIMTVTDIVAEDLLAGDRERLSRGVTVDDEEEVWLILEGLTQ